VSMFRRAPGIAGALILTMAVAACSGQASPSPSAAPSATPAPAASATPAAAASPAAPSPAAIPSLAPATVSFWWLQYEQDTSVVEAAVKKFEEAHPGVKVELSYYSYADYSKAMPAALAAGNPPDLAFGDPTAPNTPNFVKAGQLDPLAPLVAKYGWEDRLQPGAITFYNPLYGGETYGIPLFAAERGIFYNKDILAKVGGTVPTTLDELEALLAKVKTAGYTPLFMGSSDKYGVDYYWLGLALDYLSTGDWKAFTEGTMTWKPGTPWGGADVRKGTERLLKWKDAGYFNADYAALPADDLSKGFVEGKIFAIANGTNLNASIKAANPKFQVGFMNWPALDASSSEHLYISDPGQILILPKDSKHKDHAVALMDWMLSPEVGMMFANEGRIPLHKIDFSQVTGQPAFVGEQLEVAKSQTPVGWLNYMAPYEFPDREGSEMQKLLAGQTNIDAFTPFLQKTFDDSIANAK
jgi:raffinose/stachyose/melibiose transport system substrate-binding protein